MRHLSILLLLLSLPTLAGTAEDRVEKLYKTHLKSKGFQQTIVECESCFTPGFLGVIERALAKERGSAGGWVDFDFFVNSQAGFAHFELGKVETQGKKATIPVLIWNDSRGYQHEKDPVKREHLAVPAVVHLVDVGEGLQITNIEFLPRLSKIWNGDLVYFEGTDIREVLTKIGE